MMFDWGRKTGVKNRLAIRLNDYVNYVKNNVVNYTLEQYDCKASFSSMLA